MEVENETITTSQGRADTLKNKQGNRLMFRWLAIILAFLTMLAGAFLAFSGSTTAGTFGAIAVGAFGFAGAVFAADYATKVETD